MLILFLSAIKPRVVVLDDIGIMRSSHSPQELKSDSDEVENNGLKDNIKRAIRDYLRNRSENNDYEEVYNGDDVDRNKNEGVNEYYDKLRRIDDNYLESENKRLNDRQKTRPVEIDTSFQLKIPEFNDDIRRNIMGDRDDRKTNYLNNENNKIGDPRSKNNLTLGNYNRPEDDKDENKDKNDGKSSAENRSNTPESENNIKFNDERSSRDNTDNSDSRNLKNKINNTNKGDNNRDQIEKSKNNKDNPKNEKYEISSNKNPSDILNNNKSNDDKRGTDDKTNDVNKSPVVINNPIEVKTKPVGNDKPTDNASSKSTDNTPDKPTISTSNKPINNTLDKPTDNTNNNRESINEDRKNPNIPLTPAINPYFEPFYEQKFKEGIECAALAKNAALTAQSNSNNLKIKQLDQQITDLDFQIQQQESKLDTLKYKSESSQNSMLNKKSLIKNMTEKRDFIIDQIKNSQAETRLINNEIIRLNRLLENQKLKLNECNETVDSYNRRLKAIDEQIESKDFTGETNIKIDILKEINTNENFINKLKSERERILRERNIEKEKQMKIRLVKDRLKGSQLEII